MAAGRFWLFDTPAMVSATCAGGTNTVVLRCTQKLLARLRQSGDVPAVESTTRLGDWYGSILRIGAQQHLLFISERSRLSVIVPLREAKRLSTVFPEAVCDRLAVVGVTPADIAEERAQRWSSAGPGI